MKLLTQNNKLIVSNGKAFDFGIEGWQFGTFTGNGSSVDVTVPCDGTCTEVVVLRLTTPLENFTQYGGYYSVWNGTVIRYGLRATASGGNISVSTAYLNAVFKNGSIDLTSGYATAYWRGKYMYLCR